MSTLDVTSTQRQSTRTPALGTYGHLAIFGWMLAMVMLASGGVTAIAALICLGVAIALYPGAFRRIFRLRWLIWMVLLALPTLFFLGERDSLFMGIPYSSEGLQAGLQIMARYVVVLVAVQGFTSAVDITTLAGLLERCGLRGLGFSLGIAINLLPSLQESASHAWHALRMRGGLRRQWWRGGQLLVITIITNALRRAQDISLAAEARAFSPEKARPLPVQRGTFDWVPATLGMLSLLIVIML